MDEPATKKDEKPKRTCHLCARPIAHGKICNLCRWALDWIPDDDDPYPSHGI
jgi:ribosomal protein S14